MVEPLAGFKANPEWADFRHRFNKLLINGQHIEHRSKWLIYIPVTAHAPKQNMVNVDGTPRIELQPTGWIQRFGANIAGLSSPNGTAFPCIDDTGRGVRGRGPHPFGLCEMAPA